ncbi:MAG: C45 family peptidase [Bacteroidetes bacterium]|nr:C45 family peptidase [Bacteroidota bacterium]
MIFRRKRLLGYGCLIRIVFLILLVYGIYFFMLIQTPPGVTDTEIVTAERVQTGENAFSLGNSSIRKNKYGLWELYVEGAPFERGVLAGKLAKELVSGQEDAFVTQMECLVPGRFYRNFLLLFISWFDKDLGDYIPEEYRREIYGMSLSASERYDYIASGYQRLLNYHAAHDIGHALQEMHLAGCTSFSVWGGKSRDNKLIVARNFDLYLGDEFARDKIVSFVKPDSGYGFVSVSWGGMVGAVSGMNEKGLTVTINAAPSEIPFGARTPVSIVVREILQYAADIEKALAVARKRKIFVSELFMIGSAVEGKAAIIEKTPENMAILITAGNQIICTNHYQTDFLLETPLNKEAVDAGPSLSRYHRVEELLARSDSIDYLFAASVLRDILGMEDNDIGMGNEKAINQMNGHHSVVFEPESRKIWVSTQPWQLGAYVCYDLDEVLAKAPGLPASEPLFIDSLTISPDALLSHKEFDNYMFYRRFKALMIEALRTGSYRDIPEDSLDVFIASNPENYQVYVLAGDYFSELSDMKKAISFYRKALTKRIATKPEETAIMEKLGDCSEKCQGN